MSPEDIAVAVVLIGTVAYAIFGGADFGGGVWTALASGPRAAQQREAILRAMGPVWETNHVWLIFVIVTLFTAFPSAFASLFTALFVPLLIALLGIVFRGAAFAFRHFGHGAATGLPATVAVFSVASTITPIALGMALGAVAGGHIAIENGAVTSGLFEPWLRPFPLISGLVALALCGFLTAYYMTTRTTGALREDFRKRALFASLVVGALLALAIPVAYWDARLFLARLLAPAPLAVMGVTGVVWAASLAVVWQRRYVLAPPVAAGTVALVIGAWGTALYPYVILPSKRFADAAAESGTIVLFLIALAAGAVVLVPSLALLYVTFSEKTG